MNELKDILLEGAKTIDPYVKAYGGYSGAFLYASKFAKQVKHFFNLKYYDVNEIFKEVKNETIKIGSIIETGGIMLNYGQIFKPYTHVNGMFGKCSKAAARTVLKDGKLITGSAMSMSYKIFQPPVQKLPSYNGIGCAFLYDTRFNGFVHEQNPESEKRDSKPFIVNEFSKPIMVLYDVNKFGSCLNREVNLKARVIQLPLNLAKQINGIFDDNIREICSNFIDIYSESISFICLVVLDDETSINNLSSIDNLAEFLVPLYVEAELESFHIHSPKESSIKLLERIIPNLPQKIDPKFPIIIANTLADVGIPFVSINDINISFREPNIIGFYIEVRLFDKEEYSSKLQEYTNTVNNFAIDYKNLMKKAFGVKDSMKLNFLFDYEKQLLFDSRGVLYSNAAQKLEAIDEKDKYTQEWLRNSVIRI